MPQARRLYETSESEALRKNLARFMNPIRCAACHGRRLRPEILAVTLRSNAGADRRVAFQATSENEGSRRVAFQATGQSEREPTGRLEGDPTSDPRHHVPRARPAGANVSAIF